jgi:peptidoglycan-associated lipoprotein
MDCYQSAAGSIKVEGHADERGTVDYNLALGQRRADTVKSHLVGSGVATSRVSTMSYGEERPAASGHNESAWSQNRRADLTASE